MLAEPAKGVYANGVADEHPPLNRREERMSTAMNEMLEALNQAIRDTPWWIPSAPALELVGPREVLGQVGTRKSAGDLDVLGGPGLGTTGDPDAPIDGRHIYVFTRSQCKKMRKVIRDAAADATRP